jgi:hypothetical protein
MDAKPPIRYRKLRIAWSVGCGVLCLLLVVLWLRSYWRVDKVWRPTATNNGWMIWMFNGRVLSRGGLGFGGKNELQWSLSRPADEAPGDRSKPVFGFSFGPRYYSMPIWFMALISGLLTTAPSLNTLAKRIPWPRRFSLRTLLIATTLIAIILGIIAVSN